MGSFDSLLRSAFGLVRALRRRIIAPPPVAVVYVYPLREGKIRRWCWEIRSDDGFMGDGIKLTLEEAMWAIADQLSAAGISPDQAPIAWHPPLDEATP